MRQATITTIGPTTVGSGVLGGAITESIYYAANIRGGTNSVTVAFSQSAASPDVRVLEYSGLSTTSPLDVTAAANGSSTSASSGSATTTSASELIFGANTVYTSTHSAGSGFTSRIITADGDIAEDENVTSTGSYSATATLSSSGNWVMQMATFKAAAGSGTSVYADAAYAPYGEPYAQSGAADASFTGQNQDTLSPLYDFLLREQHSTEGRWITPDPAGLGAVDPTNPQTWNRYAYAGNGPLTSVDADGLLLVIDVQVGGGLGGSCNPEATSDWSLPDPCPIFPTIPPIIIPGGGGSGGGGGGGTGGSGGGGTSGSGGGGGGSANFPNGETNGLPNGYSFNWGGIWGALLPTGPSCEFGPCMTESGFLGAGVTGLGTPDSPYIIDVLVLARLLPQFGSGGSYVKPFTLPLPNVPSGSACKQYSLGLRIVCNVMPNNPTNNCVRGTLLSEHDPTGYKPNFRDAHCNAFAACGMSPFDPLQVYFGCYPY